MNKGVLFRSFLYSTCLVFATSVVSSLVIGDLTSVENPDYLWRAPELGKSAKLVMLGLVIGASALVLARILSSFRQTPDLRKKMWKATGFGVVAGIILGCGFRLVTAGVIGANIGAPVYVVAMGPLCLALFAASITAGLTKSAA